MSNYRYEVRYDDNPDMSWLDQPEFADEDRNDHVALAMLLHKECGECGEWRVVAGLWSIDMLESKSEEWEIGTWDEIDAMPAGYLREVARELVDEDNAG